jgi:2-C-methyl-D-erythritol 2,4-cyclodiphosphate synthase
MKIRIGNGFDFHRLEKKQTQKPSKPLILCGLEIDSEFSITAHSDGDIIIHTVVDAILGGLNAGDIGTLFPDSDQKWRNASSVQFLKASLGIMEAKKFEISNIDITIMCEFPKIKPLRNVLVENLAKIMNLEQDAVSIKATTTEKMGFLGRGEGIGCFATVCLIQN